MRAEAFLAKTGPLGGLLPGYTERAAQLQMAAAVEDAFDHGDVLLVEAGTGTGKTLAYLVPAILSGEKVVVSTGTLALQDQIMEHDVPLLERALGRPLSVACLKGLGNYVCRRRFEEYRAQEGARGQGSSKLPLLEAWVARTEVGDRKEFPDLGEQAPEWAAIASSADTRIGPKCAFHDTCFVTLARQRATKADVVVVNHHLYFADLALRGPHGGGFLPDHTLVVFDEAHQLEDTLTRFLGVTVSPGRIERFVRDVEAWVPSGVEGPIVDGKGALAREVLGAARAFFDAVPVRAATDGARLPLPKEVFVGALEGAMFRLDGALEAMALHLKAHGGRDEVAAQLARRAEEIRDDVATVAEGKKGNFVTWAEARGRNVTVGAAPVEVGGTFRDEVLHRHHSVVLTSATLTAGGSFAFTRSRLGIEEGGAKELALESPFDHPRQTGLYVPGHLPDPRDGAFLPRAADEIVRLIEASKGGVFVLSTSIRAMETLCDLVRPRVPFTVLLQGEAPKAALLERFRRDGHAVLFATSSFWEGIDVPGDALRLVVLDKLPFDVPTDPLVVARCEQLEAAGEQPFIRYLVPSAALTLKQGFGRLIRRETDRGVVAILDGRLHTKGYGKVLLRSLPPARRLETYDDVRTFYGDGR